MAGHTFEPELDQPVPRAVRLRSWRGINFLRLFSVVWLGVGGFLVLGEVGGVAVPGTVVNLRDAGQGGKTRYRYHADVEYVRGGRTYNASERLSAAQFVASGVGQPAIVHTHPLSPAGHRVEWPDKPEGIGPHALVAAWTVGWAAASVFIVWQAWCRPRRHRWLVRWGTPAVAIVTGGVTLYHPKGGGPYRQIRYQHAGPHATDPELTGWYDCKPGGPDDRPAGATVTVLLDPDRPRRHVALAGSIYLPNPPPSTGVETT